MGVSNLSELVARAEEQSKAITAGAQQGNNNVSLRGSVPTTYGYNGNDVNLRDSRSICEGADMTDGTILTNGVITERNKD